MNILLDSNTFQSRNLITALKEFKIGKVYINTIIDLEKRFHYLIRKKIPIWNTIIERFRITILPVTEQESKLAASYAQNFIGDPRGPSYFFRDCLIGASTTTHQLVLITDNRKDFTYLPEQQIMTIKQFLNYLENYQ